MTCREFIIFILANGLENERVEDLAEELPKFLGLISEEQVAVKFGVDVPTVRIWHNLGMIKGVPYEGALYFHDDVVDPRKGEKHGY